MVPKKYYNFMEWQKLKWKMYEKLNFDKSTFLI